MLKGKYKYVIAAIFFIGIGLFFFLRQRGSNGDYKEEKVSRRNISSTIELSGVVDAKSRADLHFAAAGLVTYFPFKEGDRVQKFQTIASLDTRQLKKTLEKQLNLYAIQRNTFDQTQDDNEGEVLDNELQRILDNSQYKLNNSVIDVELQDLSVKLSRLTSPISGILVSSPITTPNVNVGITDIFTVVDPTTLYFQADLDESDLRLVREGQKAVIVLDAFPDQEIASNITEISFQPKETATGTTFELTLPIPTSDMTNLRLGLNGTAEIILNEKQNVLTIPLAAIRENDEGQQIVLLKSGEDQEQRVVEVGIEGLDYVEITSGLSEGDTVLIEK